MVIAFCIQGTIHLYEPGVPESLKLLRDLHHGHVVGIGCLPGSEHCVVSVLMVIFVVFVKNNATMSSKYGILKGMYHSLCET